MINHKLRIRSWKRILDLESNSNFKFIVPFIIILVATFLRLAYLSTLPPGLNFDEAGNGMAALDVLQGDFKIWWTIGGGKESLWPYLIALFYPIMGSTPYLLRFLAAIFGILTIVVIYPFCLRLFHKELGGWLALFTMVGLASSAWHLHFSRLGFRAILLPFLATLAFYFFWQIWVSNQSLFLTKNSKLRISYSLIWSNNQSIVPLIASTFCLALAIYSYLAARLLPLVLLTFIISYCFLYILQHQSTISFKFQALHPTPYILRFIPYILLFIAYLILLIFFLSPLIIHFIYHPADLVARSTTVSIFNPASNHGDLIGTVWQTLKLTLSTFLGLQGDTNPLVNYPHQPAVPFWLAPLFLVGLGFAIYHSLKSNDIANPHLFILVWWSVMLLPAILAPDGAPHHLRLIGTLIPTYILIAFGFITVIKFVTYLLPIPYRLTTVLYYLLLISYTLCLTYQTYDHYFIQWPDQTDFTEPYDLYALNLADSIISAPSQVAYILPMDIRAGQEARHYTLDYLLAGKSVNYHYILVDEQNSEVGLAKAAIEKTELRVVRWTADKHLAADEKEIITYLLQTQAELVNVETYPVYQVETYTIPAGFQPQLPKINQSIGAMFDGYLQLSASYVPPTANRGTWLPVAITIAPIAPIAVDYKASVRLISSTGERILQKDRTLRHNFHQGTSLWPSETVNEYYLLDIPLEIPPGDYRVMVLFYHPETQAPLVSDGIVEWSLGVVAIN